MKATSPSRPISWIVTMFGMVQRRGRARLLLEPREPLPIQSQRLRQDLDRHLAAEPRISRPVDLSHPARTEGRQDLVVAEASAGGECHGKTVTAILAASIVETCPRGRDRVSHTIEPKTEQEQETRRWTLSSDGCRSRLAIWAGALGLCAQTLPSTGSIHGTALDEQGSPLPGVEVKLQGAGERAPVQTDARGRFRFLYISPGAYSVTLSLDGFATVDNQGVVVALDRSTELRVTMKLAAVNETRDGPGRARDRPAQDRDRRDLRGEGAPEIPSARNIWATLWAVRGSSPTRSTSAGTPRCRRRRSSKGVTGATYNLDGADITLSGISPTFYNFDSFQEVQVVTGGSDVTLLNGGATFNMVTRRGTNAVHGSARYFYAPNRWQTENTPAEVNLAGLSTNRTNVLRDYGVEAGGAVLTDRLWLWGAWGKNQIDLQKLGQLDPEGRQVNENSTLENFDARLDAQLAASNSLELYYHHGDRIQYGRGEDINTAPESRINLTQPVPIYKIADTQVFSSSLTATAFFSYMDFVQTATPVGGVDTPAYIDPNDVLRGSSKFSQIHSIVRQGGASASKFFTTGSLSHELKFGFGYRDATTEASSSMPGRQVYGDDSDKNDKNQGLAYITRAAVGTTQDQRLGVFVSDTLTSDRLTVSAGLRYDHGRARNEAASVPANPDYPDLLPAVDYPGDQGYPISAGTWQPRVGATYALGRESADPSARVLLPVRGPFSRRDRPGEPLRLDPGALLLLDGYERQPPCGSR